LNFLAKEVVHLSNQFKNILFILVVRQDIVSVLISSYSDAIIVSQNTQRVPLITLERFSLIGNGLLYWNQNSIFKLNIEMFQR